MASGVTDPEPLTRARTEPVQEPKEEEGRSRAQSYLQRLVHEVIADIGRLEVLTVSDVLRVSGFVRGEDASVAGMGALFFLGRVLNCMDRACGIARFECCASLWG